jgi:hypothetical protein
MTVTGSNGNGKHTSCAAMPAFAIELVIRDPQAAAALLELPEGRERHDHAVSALEIGLTAMGMARTRMDTEAVRHEVDRMLAALAEQLSAHANNVPQHVGAKLAEYFAPNTGLLEQRVHALLGNDGELAKALADAIDGEHSALGRTLDAYLGSESPLHGLLDPASSTSIAHAVRELVERQLGELRARKPHHRGSDRPQ